MLVFSYISSKNIEFNFFFLPAAVFHSGLVWNGIAVESQKEAQLRAALERDNVKITGEKLYAGYNPPFTLPWLKTNEVMIPVEVPA